MRGRLQVAGAEDGEDRDLCLWDQLLEWQGGGHDCVEKSNTAPSASSSGPEQMRGDCCECPVDSDEHAKS
jgi:hypothetical protein